MKSLFGLFKSYILNGEDTCMISVDDLDNIELETCGQLEGINSAD